MASGLWQKIEKEHHLRRSQPYPREWICKRTKLSKKNVFCRLARRGKPGRGVSQRLKQKAGHVASGWKGIAKDCWGGGGGGDGRAGAPGVCYRYTEACKSQSFPPLPPTATMLFRADSGVLASVTPLLPTHSVKEPATCSIICYGDAETGCCVSLPLLLTRQNQKRTMNCEQCPVCCSQRKTLLTREN